MRDFIKVRKALSDANDIKVGKRLQHRKPCVCEIKEALGLAQSAAILQIQNDFSM